MACVPLEEIDRRIKTLQTAMEAKGLNGALIIQRVDLYYFSGTGQDAHLFVPATGSPILAVRRNLERARQESPLPDVVALNGLSELKRLVTSCLPASGGCLGMELDVLPVNLFRVYEQLFSDLRIEDVSPVVRELRMIKSEHEIGLMKRAAAFNDEMFAQVRDVLREGMTELELSSFLEAFYRRNGHQGLVRVRSFNQEVFYGHIMSGPSLAVPSSSVGPTGGPGPHATLPHGAGTRAIRRNEPVQIDYVAVVEGYMVDQARTFYLGDPPAKFVKAHETALEVQRAVSAAGAAGAPAELLYETALEIVGQAGLTEGFMGYPQPVPFVGHGVGMELDELPVIGRRSAHVLAEGMTVALEPKIIFPGEGLAGIENTFLVTTQGMEKLTLFDDSIQVLP